MLQGHHGCSPWPSSSWVRASEHRGSWRPFGFQMVFMLALPHPWFHRGSLPGSVPCMASQGVHGVYHQLSPAYLHGPLPRTVPGRSLGCAAAGRLHAYLCLPPTAVPRVPKTDTTGARRPPGQRAHTGGLDSAGSAGPGASIWWPSPETRAGTWATPCYAATAWPWSTPTIARAEAISGGTAGWCAS